MGATSIIGHEGGAQSSVAIVMPTHGPLQPSDPVLEALRELKPQPDELILVLDAPPPNETRLRFLPHWRVVEVPFASGPAVARNAGAAQATANWLLFIDSDVLVPSDTVAQARAVIEHHPGLAGFFGSYDANPAAPGVLSQYRNLLHHFVHQQANEAAGTFWAGLGALRRDVFHQHGGFDTRYRRPSIEDVELGCRLVAEGHRIRVVKHLQGTHLKKWTIPVVLRTDLLHRGIPWMRLILSGTPIPRDLNTDSVARLSTMVAWLFFAALPMAGWEWRLLALLPILVATLLWLNRRFYAFLLSARGPLFAVATLPWHLIFYFECGLAAILGTFLHLADRKASQPIPNA